MNFNAWMEKRSGKYPALTNFARWARIAFKKLTPNTRKAIQELKNNPRQIVTRLKDNTNTLKDPLIKTFTSPYNTAYNAGATARQLLDTPIRMLSGPAKDAKRLAKDIYTGIRGPNADKIQPKFTSKNSPKMSDEERFLRQNLTEGQIRTLETLGGGLSLAGAYYLLNRH